MKKLITLVFALCVCLSAAIAQNVPQGMQYQAVARDNSGQLIIDQEVSLRITLKSKSDRESTPYSEVHNVSTNLVGLFTLVIGQGESVAGSFEKIPWSSSDVWMEIEILDSESGNFQTISNSKMLSVPYAFHAGSASEILGAGQQRGGDGPIPGETSKNWLTNGNDNIRAGNVLGTNTPADLMIVTDGQTRIEIAGEESGVRVTADFSVVRQFPTKLTGTLQVDGESNLNNSVNVNNTSPTNLTGTLNVDGQADFNSALYVNNMSPTFLSGALTVDKETELYDKLTVFNQSPVLLSGTLTVDLATDLNTSLNVDGITDLNSALYVNNESPTVLSGTLQGQGTATFNDKVVLDNGSYNSTSIDNGALVVAGGVGIGKNLNVGGDAAFDGDVSIAGPLALGDPTQSTDINTGALTVVGGAGIGKNVNVGGKMTVGSALNTTDFPLAVQGSTQGIKVTINGNRSNSTDFVSFFDATGMQGRIEGQTSGELGNDPGYVRETGFLSVNAGVAGTQLALAITDNVIAGFELAQAIVGLTAASTSSTACAGLGACVTAPIPSFIVSDGLAVVLKTANLAKTVANTVLVQMSNDNAYAQETAYENYRQSTIGVTYQSGAADYAEWILREDTDDDLYPGEVVGVTGGKVSRRTNDADHIMVVSSKPIILGNMPEPGKEKAYEKVAFMGQVPVKVNGKVAIGDYILPSGKSDGVALARSPEDMTAMDYENIVGVAWSASFSSGMEYVNVAVGLNANDVSKMVVDQSIQLKDHEEQLVALNNEVDEIKNLLTKLIAGEDVEAILSAMNDNATLQVTQQAYTNEDDINRKVVYFEVTHEQLYLSFENAMAHFEKQGIDIADDEFFNQWKADATFRQTVVDGLKSMADARALMQAEIDRATGAYVEFDYTPQTQVANDQINRKLIEIGVLMAENELKASGVDINNIKTLSDPGSRSKLIDELEDVLYNN